MLQSMILIQADNNTSANFFSNSNAKLNPLSESGTTSRQRGVLFITKLIIALFVFTFSSCKDDHLNYSDNLENLPIVSSIFTIDPYQIGVILMT